MSPQQASRQHPQFADDIYAIGCVILLVITGMDPRRIVFAGEFRRQEKLSALTGAPKPLIKIIDQCLREDSSLRPSLQVVRSVVRSSIAATDTETLQLNDILENGQSKEFLDARLQELLHNGVHSLLQDTISDEETGLWLSPTMKNSGQHGATGSVGGFELRRSANRGIAGTVYTLARMARFGYGTKDAEGRVRQAVDWLVSPETTAVDSDMPGLHFGDAGVAVAIAEAVASGMVARDGQVDGFLKKALHGQLDWPDITHGAAGQGIAALHCSSTLQDPSLANQSNRCAQYLIETQQRDGSWKMPPGVDGMSGETLTGFAHGVAGIVYFLAEYSKRFDVPSANDACEAGVAWLMEEAVPSENNNAIEWSYSDNNPIKWKWWCHGGPGITLTFLKMYELTSTLEFAEIARQALRIHPINIRYPNLSQCHGLSGLGEIYLEAYRILKEHEWFLRAQHLVYSFIQLARETDDKSALWLVEEPHQPTADLMVGSSGVLHFLLRFALRDSNLGFPLLLDS